MYCSMKSTYMSMKIQWKYQAKSMNLGGNLTEGDGYQKGGCLVVGAGGSPTMFTYTQEDAADHAENKDVLEALGIQAPA